MTIKKFEIDKGVYVFEESNLTAQFHAHPVIAESYKSDCLWLHYLCSKFQYHHG
jgi:hypothetical protein